MRQESASIDVPGFHCLCLFDKRWVYFALIMNRDDPAERDLDTITTASQALTQVVNALTA